ncbi:MAG TPA: hypothetical protein VNA21_04965 [Steroidobacteraceae bacterium]|nr:hypothetical protein [Steroidobacteraceae bacterium]
MQSPSHGLTRPINGMTTPPEELGTAHEVHLPATLARAYRSYTEVVSHSIDVQGHSELAIASSPFKNL